MIPSIAALLIAIFALLGGGSSGSDDPPRSRETKDRPDEVENPEPIPTPAMLPGLIGLGFSALRQRNRQKDSDSSIENSMSN